MLEKMKSFTDLKAWQEGHRLVVLVYKVTAAFPKEELFALTSQMRRAGISIVSNVAEGFSRQSYREKAQFYSMALGSLTELQSQLLVARDLGYLDAQDFNRVSIQSIKVHKMLNGLIKSTKRHYS